MPLARIKNSFRPSHQVVGQHLSCARERSASRSWSSASCSRRVVDLPAAILLYLVPIVLAASRWGRGPAITAVVAAILGHDLLFVDPRGTFSIERADEALGLVLLLFVALVTAQLADGARRGAETTAAPSRGARTS